MSTEIRPIRTETVVAGEIRLGGGAIVGETMADVLNLYTWTEVSGSTKLDAQAVPTLER